MSFNKRKYNKAFFESASKYLYHNHLISISLFLICYESNNRYGRELFIIRIALCKNAILHEIVNDATI